jgi:hypothetical protein
MASCKPLQEELEYVHEGLTGEGATTACLITIGADGTTACGLNLVSSHWPSPLGLRTCSSCFAMHNFLEAGRSREAMGTE